jgi:hypothetical protein
MLNTGLKASELIKLLQQFIKQHGDQQVFCGGTDYPGGVKDILVNKYGDAYTPKDVFVIRHH